jgi:negative elongation factor E
MLKKLTWNFQNCGFITFEKGEAAEKAILEQNGTVVEGIELKVCRRNMQEISSVYSFQVSNLHFQVTLARRQPVIDPINDSSSSTTWATIAANHNQRGSHKDKRSLVSYEENVF